MTSLWTVWWEMGLKAPQCLHKDHFLGWLTYTIYNRALSPLQSTVPWTNHALVSPPCSLHMPFPPPRCTSSTSSAVLRCHSSSLNFKLQCHLFIAPWGSISFFLLCTAALCLLLWHLPCCILSIYALTSSLNCALKGRPWCSFLYPCFALFCYVLNINLRTVHVLFPICHSDHLPKFSYTWQLHTI